MIIGICCVDNNWGIGEKNELLYRLPLDMKRFAKITSGKVVAMGANTFRSLPKNQQPLKKRLNIVLCSEGTELPKQVIACHSFQAFLALIRWTSEINDVYIIGGGQVFKSMIPYYDKILITKVDALAPEADAFFPNLDKDYADQFEISEESEPIKDNGYTTKYITYIRKSENS